MMTSGKHAIQEAARLKLTSIDLNCLDLQAVDFQELVHACPKLKRINLYHFNEKWLSLLKQLPELRSLSIGHSYLSGMGVKEICSFTKLQQLALDNEDNLRHEFFCDLVRLEELLSLTIVDCEEIGDQDLEEIAKLKNLSSLVLVRPDITDAGAVHLCFMKALTSLRIEHSSIGDQAMQNIRSCKTLVELALINCDFSSTGLYKLRSLSSLKKLKIVGLFNLITDSVLQKIGSMNALEELSLEGCTSVSEEGVHFLSSLKNLKKLSLPYNSTITHFEELPLFDKLEQLNINGWRALTEEGFSFLAGLSSLKSLHLTGSGVTDKSLEYLYGLKNLEFLDLSFCEQITNNALDNFRHLEVLRL